jgi:hypothetical protein
MAFHFLSACGENFSPLDWEKVADDRVIVSLLYDHERDAPNRAAGHWHFRRHVWTAERLVSRVEPVGRGWRVRLAGLASVAGLRGQWGERFGRRGRLLRFNRSRRLFLLGLLGLLGPLGALGRDAPHEPHDDDLQRQVCR